MCALPPLYLCPLLLTPRLLPCCRLDIVELDPCGSAAELLPSAIACLRPGGLFLASATDLGSLSGRWGDGGAAARYGGVPPACAARLGPDVAARMLLASISRAAGAAGRAVAPLLCVGFADFYTRVVVTVGGAVEWPSESLVWAAEAEGGRVGKRAGGGVGESARGGVEARVGAGPRKAKRRRQRERDGTCVGEGCARRDQDASSPAGVAACPFHPPLTADASPTLSTPTAAPESGSIAVGFWLCCAECASVAAQPLGGVQCVGRRCAQCGGERVEAGGPLWLGLTGDQGFIAEVLRLAMGAGGASESATGGSVLSSASDHPAHVGREYGGGGTPQANAEVTYPASAPDAGNTSAPPAAGVAPAGALLSATAPRRPPLLLPRVLMRKASAGKGADDQFASAPQATGRTQAGYSQPGSSQSHSPQPRSSQPLSLQPVSCAAPAPRSECTGVQRARPPLGSLATLLPLLRTLLAEAQLSHPSNCPAAPTAAATSCPSEHGPPPVSPDRESACGRGVSPPSAPVVLHIPSACRALGCAMPPLDRLLAALHAANAQGDTAVHRDLPSRDASHDPVPIGSGPASPPGAATSLLDSAASAGALATAAAAVSAAARREAAPAGTSTSTARAPEATTHPLAVQCHWSAVAFRLATAQAHNLLWDVLRSWARANPPLPHGIASGTEPAGAQSGGVGDCSGDEPGVVLHSSLGCSDHKSLRERILSSGDAGERLRLEGFWTAPSELRRSKLLARGEAEAAAELVGTTTCSAFASAVCSHPASQGSSHPLPLSPGGRLGKRARRFDVGDPDVGASHMGAPCAWPLNEKEACDDQFGPQRRGRGNRGVSVCHAAGGKCGCPFDGVEGLCAGSALCLGGKPAPPEGEGARLNAKRGAVPLIGGGGELSPQKKDGKRARLSERGGEQQGVGEREGGCACEAETCFAAVERGRPERLQWWQREGALVVSPGDGTLSAAVESAPDGAILLLSGEYTEAQAVVLRRPVTLRATTGSPAILRRRDGSGSVLVIDVPLPAAGGSRACPHADTTGRAPAARGGEGSAATSQQLPASWLGVWTSGRAEASSTACGVAIEAPDLTGTDTALSAPSVVLVGLRIVGRASHAAGEAETRYGAKPAHPQQGGASAPQGRAQAVGLRQHDSEGGYALVFRAASALVLQCTVSCPGCGGVFVTAAASAVFLRCEMSHTGAHALLASGRSRLALSHCHMHTCGSAALEVRGRATATLHCCRVQCSHRAGLFATAFAELRAEFCDCFACDFAGVEAAAQAEVHLYRCRVHHGLRGGVLGLGSSRLTLDGCRLDGNSMANLTLRGASSAQATGCVLTGSRASGAYVLEAARLELDGCVVRDNRLMQVEAAWCQSLPGRQGAAAEHGDRMGSACSMLAGGAVAERPM